VTLAIKQPMNRAITMPTTPKRVIRVLIVDDDPVTQEIVVAVFADADFVISTASNAQVALDKLERDDFDLMVTDMVQPGGLDGLELVKYARIRHPSLKSLFISGGAGPIQDDPDLDDFVGSPFEAANCSAAPGNCCSVRVQKSQELVLLHTSLNWLFSKLRSDACTLGDNKKTRSRSCKVVSGGTLSGLPPGIIGGIWPANETVRKLDIIDRKSLGLVALAT